jgi:hypothetical protein
MLHVRYNGTSYDFEVEIKEGSTDAQVREIAAQQLDVAVDDLNSLVVAKNDAGEYMVRPEAVYG